MQCQQTTHNHSLPTLGKDKSAKILRVTESVLAVSYRMSCTVIPNPLPEEVNGRWGRHGKGEVV